MKTDTEGWTCISKVSCSDSGSHHGWSPSGNRRGRRIVVRGGELETVVSFSKNTGIADALFRALGLEGKFTSS